MEAKEKKMVGIILQTPLGDVIAKDEAAATAFVAACYGVEPLNPKRRSRPSRKKPVA